MQVNDYISALIQYGLCKKLFEPCDKTYIANRIIEVLQLNEFQMEEAKPLPLEEILKCLLDDAVKRGVCSDDITHRDLLDTKLMGALTPMPREVRATFSRYLDFQGPRAATNWFYRFSQDTDYIRRYRIQKDLRWKTATEYGNLDITINLSKPEKDPKAIAAAGTVLKGSYPKCQLCVENEGYAGRMDHPARQNHRVIPIKLAGEDWCFQYSPYVYYPEHCIAFNTKHTPMVINKEAFDKLLSFVTVFPHYFIGSNADLPIVGGSILTHEHFQGGNYSFPMERAPIEQELAFREYEDIYAGIVKWPMSVIRLRGQNRERLAELASKILHCWRSYNDESAHVFAKTGNTSHNTITPIARRKADDYELDLVLRNNITTKEHPTGLFHAHENLHHIKRENIGLIEVMGLAVLPGRLLKELSGIEDAILSEKELTGALEKHAAWVKELQGMYTFTQENTASILRVEVGKAFARCLEDAGVFKRTADGSAAFLRFIDYVNKED